MGEASDNSAPPQEPTPEAEGGESAAEAADKGAGGAEIEGDAESSPFFLVEVSGIPFEKAAEDVEKFFMDGGCNPLKVTMPLRPPESNRAGQNKGRAFVELASQEELDKALGLSRGNIGDRWVTVSRLRTPLEEVRGSTARSLPHPR